MIKPLKKYWKRLPNLSGDNGSLYIHREGKVIHLAEEVDGEYLLEAPEALCERFMDWLEQNSWKECDTKPHDAARCPVCAIRIEGLP